MTAACERGRVPGRRQRPARPAEASPWQRRACGIGTKGFRVCLRALVESADPAHQYMIRRSPETGELACYHCFNPRRDSAAELVRVAGARWPVGECFAAAKNEAGLDHYPDALARGLAWSTWRRARQAHARRSHFRRRLKLQVMQI